MKIFFRLLYPVICIGFGWILGSKYQAPEIVIKTTDQLILATQNKIESALLERETIIEQIALNETPASPSTITEQTDSVIIKPDPGRIAPAPITNNEVILASNGLSPFVKLCKMPKISNAPSTDSHGHIKTYRQLIDIKGVTMAMMPVRKACLSSGFGRRKGKLHKGVDYFSKDGGTIFAAADGQILEAEYRNDYGFTVLINHGNGYFTRYAHLAGFTDGVVVGAAVPRGFALGEMGRTAGYNIPKHLHFELLQGDYETPKKSFGLKPVNMHAL